MNEIIFLLPYLLVVGIVLIAYAITIVLETIKQSYSNKFCCCECCEKLNQLNHKRINNE